MKSDHTSECLEKSSADTDFKELKTDKPIFQIVRNYTDINNNKTARDSEYLS